MENNKDNNIFTYTYTAINKDNKKPLSDSEIHEIQKIRKKYLPKNERAIETKNNCSQK